MPADLLEPADPGRIVDEPIEEALSSRYLAYALSTITQRALPDVFALFDRSAIAK